MIEAIVSGVGTAVEVCGSVLSSIFGEAGALKDLLPVIGLGIGFSAAGWAIHTIKSLTWGF